MNRSRCNTCGATHEDAPHMPKTDGAVYCSDQCKAEDPKREPEPAQVIPCSCKYWEGETQGFGSDDDTPMSPQALYDPETGHLCCIECGAALLTVSR